MGTYFLIDKMDKKALKFDQHNLQYYGIIGIIGIRGLGSGKFFKLNGDHKIGRDESRIGHFLYINDYCNQHIILHYLKVLLEPFFTVIPNGKIGDEDVGNYSFNEMSTTGFNMNHIEKVLHTSTLSSFSFQFPDGSSGNLTTDNPVSAQVDSAFIENAGEEIKKFGSKGIIIAVPEVPLSERQKLLKLGKQQKLFCAASFTSEELQYAMDSGIRANIDLIAFNIHESFAVTGASFEEMDTNETVKSTVRKVQTLNKSTMVSNTPGKQGSLCLDDHSSNALPAIKAEAISTAGARDEFFSGLLCGINLGFNPFESQQFVTSVAGLSVTFPHTIHKGIDRHSLRNFTNLSDHIFSKIIIKLMEA